MYVAPGLLSRLGIFGCGGWIAALDQPLQPTMLQGCRNEEDRFADSSSVGLEVAHDDADRAWKAVFHQAASSGPTRNVVRRRMPPLHDGIRYRMRAMPQRFDQVGEPSLKIVLLAPRKLLEVFDERSVEPCRLVGPDLPRHPARPSGTRQCRRSALPKGARRSSRDGAAPRKALAIRRPVWRRHPRRLRRRDWSPRHSRRGPC